MGWDDFVRDDFGPNLGTILAGTISARTIFWDDFGQDDFDPYREKRIAFDSIRKNISYWKLDILVLIVN